MKKQMKKIASIIMGMALLLSMGITVTAATPIDQASLLAAGTKTTANLSGSTNDVGCTAVFVALYDSDGTTVLRSESTNVQDYKFQIAFDKLSLKEGLSYTMKVADYDGGDWEVATFTVASEHTHDFGTAWESDKTNHWHECSCGEKTEIGVHTFGAWKETKAATATEKGSKERICSVCKYIETAEIAVAETKKDSQKTEVVTAKGAETGDSSNITIMIVLLMASGGVLIALVRKRRKL